MVGKIEQLHSDNKIYYFFATLVHLISFVPRVSKNLGINFLLDQLNLQIHFGACLNKLFQDIIVETSFKACSAGHC